MLLSSLVIATLFAVKTSMLSRQRRKIALVDSLTKSDHIGTFQKTIAYHSSEQQPLPTAEQGE